jgi:hypothetical protein
MMEKEFPGRLKAIVVNCCKALASLFLCWLLPGQEVSASTGDICSEERSVPAFEAIQVNGSMSVRFTVAPHRSVLVIGPAAAISQVRTAVENGRLIIDTEASLRLVGPIRIEATGPSLDSIALAGSGDVKVNGLAGKSVQLDIAGSGNIVAHGAVEHSRIHVAGSGNVDGSVLKASEIEVQLSGSGDIRAYASHSARIAMTGSGNIVIAGNPAQRDVNRVGSGSVQFN